MSKPKTHKKMYRQGDVLLIEATPPEFDHKPVDPENGRLILVRGEATGHHHSVAAKHAILCLVGAEMFLRCLRKTDLEHQEHGPIPLDPGTYRVIRQKEYTSKEYRNVAD